MPEGELGWGHLVEALPERGEGCGGKLGRDRQTERLPDEEAERLPSWHVWERPSSPKAQGPLPAVWQRPLPSASVSQVTWGRVACNRGRAGPVGGHRGGAGSGLAAPPAGASGREPALSPGFLFPLHGPDAHAGLPDPGGDSGAGGWPWVSLGHFPFNVGQVMTRVPPAPSQRPPSQGNPWVPSRCVPGAVCRAGTGEAGG